MNDVRGFELHLARGDLHVLLHAWCSAARFLFLISIGETYRQRCAIEMAGLIFIFVTTIHALKHFSASDEAFWPQIVGISMDT